MMKEIGIWSVYICVTDSFCEFSVEVTGMTSEPAPTGSNWQVVGVDAVVLVRTLDAVYTLSAGSLGPGRRARPQQRFNELFKGI